MARGALMVRLGDAGLDALVDGALASQPGLQRAQARVRQAQAAADAANGARQPQEPVPSTARATAWPS